MSENEEGNESDFGSPVLSAAIALHEMFITLMEAGFTEAQALLMTVEMLKGSGQ